MDLTEFTKTYKGCRIESEGTVDALWGEPNDSDDQDDESAKKIIPNLDFEMPSDEWRAINPQLPERWRVRDWAERPVRFVDGKDEGKTVMWFRGPAGHPIPVRLSEIGSVTMRVFDGELRREFVKVEHVVSMVTTSFPWEEVESFAAALQENEMRLLPALPPEGELSYDFEKMSLTARYRSNYEMSVLEEVALAQDAETPTVVDGSLESHEGGFDTATSPVFGVIKKHRQNYLHPAGLQLLYQLAPRQRTPAIVLQPSAEAIRESRKRRLAVVTWYVRLCGEGLTPNTGFVRVEVALEWFVTRGYGKDEVNSLGIEFINQLSRTVFEYRCREQSYNRAAISLHPIVRAEKSLGALFSPRGVLKNKFYKLTGL